LRVLFLSRWFPHPPDNGSKIRVFNVLKQLSRRHEVELLTFRDRTDRVGEGDFAVLRGICSHVQALPSRPFRPARIGALAAFLSPQPRYLVDTYSQEMAAAVAQRFHGKRFDLVVASQLGMVPYTRMPRGMPMLLEELELSIFLDGFVRCRRPLEKARRWLTWSKLAFYLRRRLPEFAACTVVSELEKRNVERAVPGYKAVRVVPNAVDLDRYRGEFGAPKPGSIIFCGALTFGANFDAVSSFLSVAYPLILRSVPDATLLVSGTTEGVDLAALPSHPGVRYTGYLADVRPAMAQSWVSVVPLRVGGGTRLKILESMALGTPVVSTSKGVEGLEVADGVNVLIADEPEQFAAKVVALVRSAALRERLSAAGRELVESKYDWWRVGGELCDLVDEVVPGS